MQVCCCISSLIRDGTLADKLMLHFPAPRKQSLDATKKSLQPQIDFFLFAHLHFKSQKWFLEEARV